MIRYAMALLVVVAVTVAGAVASAHAARMNHYDNLASHTSHLAATGTNSGHSCGDAQSCDPASAELCTFVCAGLLNFVLADQEASVLDRRMMRLKRPSVTVASSHEPGRNNRPPISHLL
jgi:hypothetical protein